MQQIYPIGYPFIGGGAVVGRDEECRIQDAGCWMAPGVKVCLKALKESLRQDPQTGGLCYRLAAAVDAEFAIDIFRVATDGFY